MGKTSLKIVVEIKITSITCPNVRLDPSKWLNLRICLLGFHLRSRLLKAHFPLQINEKLRVERTFPLCSTPMHLYSALCGERLSVELVQLLQVEARVLAQFNADLNDILFGDPQTIRDREARTEYLSMVLHTTHHFPGIANPHMNASITVRLLQVRDPLVEISRDGGQNVTLGLKAYEHPYYGVPLSEPTVNEPHWCSEKQHTTRLCQKMLMIPEKKPEPRKVKPPESKLFVVRRVDEKLIGRTPSSEPDVPFINRSCCGRRVLKSPWYKSTSHLDTISSLLRRKPHIVRPIHSASLDSDIDTDWCSTDRMRKERSCDFAQSIDNLHHLRDFEYSRSLSPDVKVYWANHQSEMCTVCELYQQYFGECYPRHSI